METLKKTHPLVLAAAASVTVASLVGAAAIGGLLPIAHSERSDIQVPKIPAIPERPHHAVPKLPAYANQCTTCGTVAAIHTVVIRGDASGLGAVAGGLTGALVGNQIGRGNGNTAMTLLGAAGGAFAGNEIEKNVKKHYRYRVTVRMDDGSYRTVSLATPPAVGVGQRVRVENGSVITQS